MRALHQRCQGAGWQADVAERALRRVEQRHRVGRSVVGQGAGPGLNQVGQRGAHRAQRWACGQAAGPGQQPAPVTGAQGQGPGRVLACRGIFAHQLGKVELAGCVARLQQRMADQLVQQQQQDRTLAQRGFVGAHSQRGGGAETTAKHAQPGQQALCRGGQQGPAPVQHLLHRGMPQVMRGTRARARQQDQGGAAAWRRSVAQDLRRTQAAHAGGGQLDRQWQATQRMQQGDQLGQTRAGLARVQRKVAAHRAGSVQKQRQRRVARQVGQAAQRRVGRGQCQGRQRANALAVQAQYPARGDQPMHLRQARGQSAQQRRTGLDQLLEVVQHHQPAALGQGVDQRIDGASRVGAGRRQAQCQQQRVEHVGLAAAMRQWHKVHPLETGQCWTGWPRLVSVQGAVCQLHRQAGFATAARADQVHQTVLGQRRTQLGHAGMGPDQARQVARQRVAPRRRRQARTRRQQACQALGHGRQARAFVVDPGVVDARQQLAPVQRQGLRPGLRLGLGRIAQAGQPLKALRVALQRAWHQAHAAPVGTQHRRSAGWLQRCAQG